jgi:hypothetical protein
MHRPSWPQYWAMLGAAAIGAQHGDFSALRMLWSVIGLQLRLVIGRYFEVKDKVMKITRVYLELPEPSIERLKALIDKTEAASYAEVIKNSCASTRPQLPRPKAEIRRAATALRDYIGRFSRLLPHAFYRRHSNSTGSPLLSRTVRFVSLADFPYCWQCSCAWRKAASARVPPFITTPPNSLPVGLDAQALNNKAPINSKERMAISLKASGARLNPLAFGGSMFGIHSLWGIKKGAGRALLGTASLGSIPTLSPF